MEVILLHTDWRPAHQKGQWPSSPRPPSRKPLPTALTMTIKKIRTLSLRNASRAESQEPNRISVAWPNSWWVADLSAQGAGNVHRNKNGEREPVRSRRHHGHHARFMRMVTLSNSTMLRVTSSQTARGSARLGSGCLLI